MIRAAAQGDADTIARLQLRAVVRAAGEAVDPEQLGTVEERVAGWAQQLADPARSALVFDLDGLLAGVVAFAGPAAGTATGELLALYVDPPAQGAGVGGALLDAAEDRLGAAGAVAALLWVPAANEHARHVAEQRDWALDADAERPGDAGPEVRYRKAL